MASPETDKPFFSLRWKVVVALNVVLLLSSVAIIIVTEQHISGSFAELQDRQLQYQFNNWQSLLADGEEKLLQLSALIPKLESNAKEALPLAERMRDILARHMDLLNLEWDIQSITFYDANGVMRAAWPAAPKSRLAGQLVRQVQQSQDPVSGIECDPFCTQYVAAPVISSHAKGRGILLMGQSIAATVISFSRLSGSEIAILKPAAGNASAMRIERWRQDIPAISHPRDTLPLLKSLSRQYSLDELEQRSLVFHDGERWVRVALQQDSTQHFAYLLIMDITQAVHRMDETRTLIISLGIAAYLATTLLLLWLLHGPLSRLLQLIAVLPLIGEHEHDRARKQLSCAGQSRLGRDEIDILNQAIDTLNNDLQAAEEARSAAELQLLWLAEHDPLTGLSNRRRFQEDFARGLQQAIRHHHSGALLYFDVDDFKAVNDLSGHQAGDELLRRIATTISNSIRETDFFARLGGDEFAIIIPQCTREEAIAVAEKLQVILGQIEFSTDNRRHAVSCSIGIALFPQHGDDVKTLLANADISMYQAKRMGQGRWHLFSPEEEYREVLSTRSYWRRRISEALAGDRFLLHYQPILDIRSNRIVRYEALVRMQDQESLICPDRFIPIAEKTGQIHEIDRWVIRHSLEQLAGYPGLHLSVNLSGSVVDDPDLPVWLKQRFSEHCIDPRRLVFEITETAAVENMDGAIALMNELHSLGCAFALDDFGTGFASYQYLRLLPVDLVKIDGAFIRNLARDPADQMFVKALADVAHALGKQTVAEFVEDQQTLELLRSYGVHYAQGYHIGRPRASVGTAGYR